VDFVRLLLNVLDVVTIIAHIRHCKKKKKEKKKENIDVRRIFGFGTRLHSRYLPDVCSKRQIKSRLVMCDLNQQLPGSTLLEWPSERCPNILQFSPLRLRSVARFAVARIGIQVV